MRQIIKDTQSIKKSNQNQKSRYAVRKKTQSSNLQRTETRNMPTQIKFVQPNISYAAATSAATCLSNLVNQDIQDSQIISI